MKVIFFAFFTIFIGCQSKDNPPIPVEDPIEEVYPIPLNKAKCYIKYVKKT